MDFQEAMKEAVRVLCSDNVGSPNAITAAMSGLAETATLDDPTTRRVHPTEQERAMRLFGLLNQRLASIGR